MEATHEVVQQPPPTAATSTHSKGMLLQKKCACGGSPGLSGLCDECQGKRLTVQRYPATRQSLAGLLPTVTSQAAVTSQSQNGNSDVKPEVDRPAVDKRTTSAEQGTDAAPRTASLIVEDQSREIGPGQMRKSEFFTKLRGAISAAADAELAAVGRSSANCPYIEQWLGYYGARSTDYAERALHRYAPEAAGVTDARDYIALVAARVRRSVTVWARTGELSGIPDELGSQTSQYVRMAAVARGLSNASGGASILGGMNQQFRSVFAKARDGGVRDSSDPQEIQSQLGAGHSLDGRVKSQMESAFGHDFSQVRVHSDNQAATLSSNLNARAFTIGSHVAFAAGEYQPGTLVGDALLAHELAHVVQQSSASSAGPVEAGSNQYSALEEDADHSAVGAVVSIWGGAKAKSAKISQNAKSSLRSGLRLQRCGYKVSQAPCNNPVKTLSVDLISMRGSSRNPSDDLELANAAFRACCVQFSVGKSRRVEDADSDAWLGGDTDLTRDHSCSTASGEEEAMRSNATTKFSLNSRIKVFYVEDMTPGLNGVSFPPYCNAGTRAPFLYHTFISNSANRRTLAHELGHQLLNCECHNQTDSDNLLIPNGGGAVLDTTQCSTIYGNA